jgi:hypothetical protein
MAHLLHLPLHGLAVSYQYLLTVTTAAVMIVAAAVVVSAVIVIYKCACAAVISVYSKHVKQQ